MSRLYIAEKPSVAKAIAEVLGVTQKRHGFYECGNDIVAWCVGHLLELAAPDCYTPDDVPLRDGKKIWRVEDLPIIPNEWILQPKEDKKELLEQLGALMGKATEIVHCGDIDREGQSLVDEVLEWHGNTLPVLRYLSSGLDAPSVRHGLESLIDNSTKKAFGDASIGRQRADWLIGMNLSRAFTLRAERSGSRALLTVGRVQTPVLSLVVNRDREIENFKPIPYHTLKANLQHEDATFVAKWKAKDDQAGLDSEGRLTDTAIADALVEAMKGHTASVIEAKSTTKKIAHPQAYSLSALTILVSQKFGYTAVDVLDICQSLYEKHKLTTYPRSDCGFLPTSQFDDAPAILASLKAVNPELTKLIDGADPKIKSKTWDDSKVSAHHGIIPTQEVLNKSALTEKERNVYELIVRTYIAQFYPVHEFLSTSIELDIAGESFSSSGRVITKPGWKEVFIEADEDSDEDKDDTNQQLPALKKGDSLRCESVTRRDAKTKAPSRFTDGTLIGAMVNIHKYVEGADNKKMLREGDGLGTEATRAAIIAELIRREYLKIDGKNLVSTTLGRSVVDALPEMVKSPVLTALFERMLKNVENGAMPLADFVAQQETFVRTQVEKANVGSVKIAGAKTAAPISDIYKCGICNHGLIRRPTSKRGHFWWGCSHYPNCLQMYADINGRPNYAKPIKPKEPETQPLK